MSTCRSNRCSLDLGLARHPRGLFTPQVVRCGCERADKSGAKVALILGDEELAGKQVGIKPLRQDADQQTVPWEQAVKTINSISGDA